MKMFSVVRGVCFLFWVRDNPISRVMLPLNISIDKP